MKFESNSMIKGEQEMKNESNRWKKGICNLNLMAVTYPSKKRFVHLLQRKWIHFGDGKVVMAVVVMIFRHTLQARSDSVPWTHPQFKLVGSTFDEFWSKGGRTHKATDDRNEMNNKKKKLFFWNRCVCVCVCVRLTLLTTREWTWQAKEISTCTRCW